MTLYLHDIPANKVIDKSFAHIQLNGETRTLPIVNGAISVTFNVDLQQGELDFRAWFDDLSDESGLGSGLAAFYMYVENSNL